MKPEIHYINGWKCFSCKFSIDDPVGHDCGEGSIDDRVPRKFKEKLTQ